MNNIEEATSDSISFEEQEMLIKLILTDFSLERAAEIKSRIHNTPIENCRTIGLSIQDFIKYESSLNNMEKSMFTYFYHINSLIKTLVKNNLLCQVTSHSMGLPMLDQSYMSIADIDNINWDSIDTYAKLLGTEYILHKVSPFIACVVGEDSNRDEHNASGVLIHPQYVLTCKHVVTDMKLKFIELNQKKINILNQICSPNIDIALLEIEEVENTHNIYNNIIFGTGKVLEKILILGYPPIPMMRDNYLLVQKGEINAQTKDYSDIEHFIYSSIVRPGNSGGPIFSNNGLLIGLVTEHLEHKAQERLKIKPNKIYKSLRDIAKYINSTKNIVPFYAGLTSKEINLEIKRLCPNLKYNFKHE